jgi:cyclophilin family peptidyl-prolyl cis-trans isomerase
MITRLGFLAAALLAAAPATAASLKMEVSKGCSLSIALNEKAAPNHVAQVAALAKKGFYDGVIFHRVIDGFMAQTGDPTGTGMGGSDMPDIKAEFSSEHFARGTVGMARSQSPDSANSQFFIMFADGGFLDGQYTVFGQVDEAGMACVDKIEKGEPPANPDKIVKLSVE